MQRILNYYPNNPTHRLYFEEVKTLYKMKQLSQGAVPSQNLQRSEEVLRKGVAVEPPRETGPRGPLCGLYR